MKQNEDPESQLDALKVLLKMASKEDELQFSQNDKKFLAESMRKHISKVEIQILTCGLFAMLATNGKNHLYNLVTKINKY